MSNKDSTKVCICIENIFYFFLSTLGFNKCERMMKKNLEIDESLCDEFFVPIKKRVPCPNAHRVRSEFEAHSTG